MNSVKGALVRIVVLDDGETYGRVDGCVILEVDDAGVAALDDGETARGLVQSGEARLVAEFINGRLRMVGGKAPVTVDEAPVLR